VGEAVLGLIGTEKRLDYTAIGDSVNTAKRIQENASGGQILISHAAYMMVRNHIVVGEAIPIQAKGKRDPIIVYEIIGMK
jgi:adenylate cyclase